MNKNGVTYLFQIPGEVRFFDQPGAKLWPLPQKQWEELQRYRPEVVFWCLGGNSIDKDISPAVIYHEIIELVDTLKQAGVKKVYVSEISERGNFRKSPGLTKEAWEMVPYTLQSFTLWWQFILKRNTLLHFLNMLYNCYRFTGLLTLFQVIFRSFNAYLILIFLQQTSPIKKIAVTAL